MVVAATNYKTVNTKRRTDTRDSDLALKLYLINMWIVAPNENFDPIRSSPHFVHGPTQCTVFLTKICLNIPFYTTYNLITF